MTAASASPVGPERSRPRRLRAQAALGSSRAELFLAGFGLFLCTGVPGGLTFEGFRWLKHGFYTVVLLLLLVRWQRSLRLAARDWALCLIALLLLVSSLWSDMPVWALKRGAVIVQTTLFGLYLASRFSMEQQVRMLAWVFLLTLGICALSLPFDWAWMTMAPGQAGEAFRGPLYHKNAVGRLMSLAIPVLLIEARARPSERWLWWGTLLGAAAMLALSQALSGMLVAGMLCSVVLLHPLARRRGRLALLLPVLLFALGAFAATAGWLDDLLVGLGKDPTLTGRTQIWELTLRQIAERPLLGHSVASFWQLSSVAKMGVWFSNAHNGYLQLLVDLGAVGFLLLAVQLFVTLARSLALAERRSGVALWPYCAAAYLFVYNLAEVSLMEENSIVWVTYVAASLVVRSRTSRKRAARPVLRARGATATRAAKPGPVV